MSPAIPIHKKAVVLCAQHVPKCSAFLQPQHATELTANTEKEGTAACQCRASSRGRTSAAFPEGFGPFPY